MSKEQLKNLPTPELDDRLQAELREDIPDGDLVREILRVLEEREKDQPVEITPQIQAAWDKINRAEQGRTDRVRPTARSWVKKAAAVVATAAVLCIVLLGVIPQPAKAESVWEKLFRFTDSIFEFVNSQQTTVRRHDYEFSTENPGLQEVYDAVVGVGVTDPVVPMWLPDGYSITECKTVHLYSNITVSARFASDTGEVVFEVKSLTNDVIQEYHKDKSDVVEYEVNGITHCIMGNKDNFVVVWSQNNHECFLTIDCIEDEIYKIILSIYSAED